jgi:hypothetical protein
MDASCPVPFYFIFFFPEKSKRGGSQGSALRRAWNSRTFELRDTETLGASGLCDSGQEAAPLWAVVPVFPWELLNLCLPRLK